MGPVQVRDMGRLPPAGKTALQGEDLLRDSGKLPRGENIGGGTGTDVPGDIPEAHHVRGQFRLETGRAGKSDNGAETFPRKPQLARKGRNVLEILPERVLEPEFARPRIRHRPFPVAFAAENPTSTPAAGRIVPEGLRFDHENAAGRKDDVVDLRRRPVRCRQHDIVEDAEPFPIEPGPQQDVQQQFAGRSGTHLQERDKRGNGQKEEEKATGIHGKGRRRTALHRPAGVLDFAGFLCSNHARCFQHAMHAPETEMQSTKNSHPGESAAKDGGRQPDSPEKYREDRQGYEYYKVARSLLLSICREGDSILDVGPRGVDMVSFLPCRDKKTIDLQYPYADETTQGIKGNYLAHDARGTDIITCFQVLEHLRDEDAVAMARKLLDESRIAIVSVPYMWAKGQCKWHVQDPVDVDKLVSWFGTVPVLVQKATEKDRLSRIVAVFVKGRDANLDLGYWRQDAKDTAEAYGKYRKSLDAGKR